MKDLLVTVADSDQKTVLENLLPRLPLSSGTRPFTFDIIKNTGKDSGSYVNSDELLRPYIHKFRFSLVVFDYEGAGIPKTKNRVEAETEVERLLSINGWNDRNAVIIIDPELENWMWVNSTHVSEAIGWRKAESLYNWAKEKKLIIGQESKPKRPKESLDLALRLCQKARTASIYENIARKVKFTQCEDPALQKMISKLIEWFPINS